MKEDEKDFNDETEFAEKIQERGWREIDDSHRARIPKNVSLRDCKSRITIYLDADIVDFFKKAAETGDGGYQTLINRTLRGFVDGTIRPETVLTEDKLFDEDFLSRLKEKLAAV
ncbi:MAG: BrnA antitoxin family protein [Pyrinomonadaceae bacterium]|nr:BrnA antitoxin family protein [Pyrinomonadaceae bacterium]